MASLARPPVAFALAAALGLCLSSLTGAGAFTQTAQGDTITLRVIVVSGADAAQAIAARLERGESFAAVAKAESTAPSAEDGGWLGKVAIAELRPEVRQALERLTPGRTTAVIRIPTGFAIFKVEENEATGPSGAGGGVTPALASSGAVKYLLDVSGFVETQISLQTYKTPAEWNSEPRAGCDARRQSIAGARRSLEAYLAPENASALASHPALDVMQFHIALGQLDAFEGRMDSAIARFEEARRITAVDSPDAALSMEETLGIAYFHKAEMDNDAYAAPGALCLLGLRPGSQLAKTTAMDEAITHLSRYLEHKPVGELEARWLLNLAYMRIGAYPDKVPPAWLIPPAAFQSGEDVGQFRDVANAAGLRSFHSAGGVIVDDFRNSGRLDIVTSTLDKCEAMTFFANNGDGTFSDRTAPSGLGEQFGGLNILQGDYNNDGCPDIVNLRGGWEGVPQRKSLLRNNCDGTFTDVTVASGLATPTTTQTAVWTDFDNDGFLDLFVGQENGRAQLFHNKHDGTFEDVAKAAGVDRTAFTKGVAAGDYDNDGYPDLYVSNFGTQNFLYHNNRDGTFTEVSAAAGVLGSPTGFATWFFDYDNDGWPDLFATSYVTSIDEMVRDYLHMPHNGTTMKLYRNLGNGTFRDVTAEAGLNRVLMPMGSNFGDIDNDGFPDIYLGTGNPSYAGDGGQRTVAQQRGGGPGVRGRLDLVRHGRTAQGPRRRVRGPRQRRRRRHPVRGGRRHARRPARPPAVREPGERQRLDRPEARRRQDEPHRRRGADHRHGRQPGHDGARSPIRSAPADRSEPHPCCSTSASAGPRTSWTWRSGGRLPTRDSISATSLPISGSRFMSSATTPCR